MHCTRFASVIVLGFAFAAVRATAPGAAAPVAVLPLVLSAASDDYTIVPKAAELGALTAQLRDGIAVGGALNVVAVSREQAGGCTEAECARTLGRSVAARTVIYGTIARLTGPRWSTQLTALDVRSGRVIDTFTLNVPGEYEALMSAERRLGTCVRRSVTHDVRCKSDASQP